MADKIVKVNQWHKRRKDFILKITMRKKPFNNVGQHITEYTLLIALVVAGVIVMGPYVKRSWNGQMRSWEVSVKDSVYDPLKQASAISIPVNCECSYNGGACVVGADEVLPNGDICQVRKKVFGVNCTPIGCPATIEPYCSSDYSNDCCGNFQALYNCGATNNLACCWGESNLPSGIPNPTSTPYYGQILRQKECGNPASPTIEYEWQSNTACQHVCLRSGAEDTSWFNGLPAYSGLCTGDDNEVPSQTEYTTVTSTGCTDAVKCQVKCNTALGYIPGTASGLPVCKCPAGQTPNGSGQCVAAERKKLNCTVYSGNNFASVGGEACSAGTYNLFLFENSDCDYGNESDEIEMGFREAWHWKFQAYDITIGGNGERWCGEYSGSNYFPRHGWIKICCQTPAAADSDMFFRCRPRSIQSKIDLGSATSWIDVNQPPCGYAASDANPPVSRRWETPPDGPLTTWLQMSSTGSGGEHDKTTFCCKSVTYGNTGVGPNRNQLPDCRVRITDGGSSYLNCDGLESLTGGDYWEELFHYCGNSNDTCDSSYDKKYTICCKHSTMYYTPNP